MARDLAEFFFNRDYLFTNALNQMLASDKSHFGRILVDYILHLVKLNECDESTRDLLVKRGLDSTSSHVLVKLKTGVHLYLNQQIFNLVMYLALLVVQKLDGAGDLDMLESFVCVNSDLESIFNESLKQKIFTINSSKSTDK